MRLHACGSHVWQLRPDMGHPCRGCVGLDQNLTPPPRRISFQSYSLDLRVRDSHVWQHRPEMGTHARDDVGLDQNLTPRRPDHVDTGPFNYLQAAEAGAKMRG